MFCVVYIVVGNVYVCFVVVELEIFFFIVM